jgi:NTE family protein
MEFTPKFKHRYFVIVALTFLSACSNAPIKTSEVTLPEALPIVVIKSDRPLIGLALGSGGSRGFAHIGVIKVLEENNIGVDIVAGTSAGSVVGALYAGGYHAKELEQLALKLDEKELRDFELSIHGYIRGERLQEFINQALHNRTIEQLDKPFTALATDLSNGKVTAFNHGNTGLAVRASSSIPGVFQPVTIKESKYVDGALKSPVPVNIAHKMGADIVIAVDVSQPVHQNIENPNILEILTQSLRIMREKLTDDDIIDAEVIIRPLIGISADINSFSKQKMILAGEDAAIAALPAIREWLKKRAIEKSVVLSAKPQS